MPATLEMPELSELSKVTKDTTLPTPAPDPHSPFLPPELGPAEHWAQPNFLKASQIPEDGEVWITGERVCSVVVSLLNR